MRKNYKLIINDLDSSSNIEEYTKLLQREWDNNVYYSYQHLKNFENNTDKLRYFLLNIEDVPAIIMPFILREIEFDKEETPYYDVVSPYGYNGPLFNNDVIDDDLLEFWKSVDEWYNDNNVISEFIRFSLNGNYTNYSGNIIESLNNVRGHLFDTFDDQWTAFSSKVRNNYRKATSFNLDFKIYSQQEITEEVIKVFNDIYLGTMTRNNASSAYFFSFDYFKDLILSNLSNFCIAITSYQNIPISTELIINYKDTSFAFLGGTNADYYQYRPNDFLRVKIIEWVIGQKKKFYVLGGGIVDGDGLYKNKKLLFPKDKDVTFCTGRKIVNKIAYDKLSNIANNEYSDISQELLLKEHYFPFYRS